MRAWIERYRIKLLSIYEIFMATLALVIVAILFIEFTRPLTEKQANLLANIDLSILIIFAFDYFYRLAIADNKWQFVKSNIFDLIAIMPFDKAFRIARLARLVRLARMARFTKVIRLFAFAHRFGNTFAGVLKTNGLIYMIIITVTIVIVFAFGISAFEPGIVTFGDALWWSLTTTVGYGDISPETAGGRILAGVLMIVGIGFLGMVTGSIATFFVDRLSQSKSKANKSFINEQIDFIKGQLDNLENMDQLDIESLNNAITNIWKQGNHSAKEKL
jgi:voltage-gated potassium channel